MKRILNLGCGVNKIENAINADVNATVNPDIVFDANKIPYPFKDNIFDVIYCYDVLEHLDDTVGVMREIHRVLRKGGRIIITTPHFSSSNSFTDPTHKHHFSSRSFDFFTGGMGSFYTKVRFRKIKQKIHFQPIYFAIQALANTVPIFYETYLCWIFPAHHIYVELEAIK